MKSGEKWRKVWKIWRIVGKSEESGEKWLKVGKSGEKWRKVEKSGGKVRNSVEKC